MSKSETLEMLRRDMENVQAEPFDPIASFYTDVAPLPPPRIITPPHIVDTGGYPIEDVDRFLREEAEHFQTISGEESQC